MCVERKRNNPPALSRKIPAMSGCAIGISIVLCPPGFLQECNSTADRVSMSLLPPCLEMNMLGHSTCCKFQVLIKKIHWSLDNISSLQNSFLFMPIFFFLFDGNLSLGVQKLKVGMILFVFILTCEVQLLKSFGNYVLFPEFRHKEMFNNKYTIKLLICISEIIWRKSELEFLPIGTHL